MQRETLAIIKSKEKLSFILQTLLSAKAPILNHNSYTGKDHKYKQKCPQTPIQILWINAPLPIIFHSSSFI